MIVLLLFQLGWCQTDWNTELNQLELSSSRLKERLVELNGYFSSSNHGNIPVLSIEDSMIDIELELQYLEVQMERLKQP